MSQMHDIPDESDFGHDFNYALWTAGTTVQLCNVPWNSDYRDIVRFDSQDALDSYLVEQTGPSIQIKDMSYAQVGRPIRINVPFHRVYTYNYLRAFNPAQPVPGGDTARAFYYFISDVRYIAPNTTEIQIQIDVWQSFGYQVQFGNCYIERGHIGIANERGFDNYGRDYLTVPEGLDLGSEYQIEDQWFHDIASTKPESEFTTSYDILVASTVSLDTNYGDVNAPLLKSATGSSMENLPNGAELYLFNNLESFRDYMRYLKDYPWISQGIISITAIPKSPEIRYNMDTQSLTIDTDAGITIREVLPGRLNKPKFSMAVNWRDSLAAATLGRYRNLKKFLTFPYMFIEMTSYTGTPLVIKPECWADDDAAIVEVPHFAPPSPRIMFYPFRYNATRSSEAQFDSSGTHNDGGEFLDMATGILNLPTFSIVNDGYLSFMAANANGIAFQQQSADWSQQRALTGNQLAYDQASAGMALSQNVTRQGINAATAQTNLANETAGYSAIQSGINGAIGGLSRGGAAGAIGALGGAANAAADYAIGANQRNQALGISNNLAAGVNRAQVNNAGYIRDSNKSYADYATRGDYQNAIAAINAKVQDAKLTQPSTSGQVGGDAFNLAVYKWGVDLKIKMTSPAIRAAIGEYWLRYGYAVNRFGRMPASFRVMQKFTYWKLRETYITSSACPESFKQAIRGIFEKGVTVWSDPNDIGWIDIADNEPLDGVVL